MDIDKYTQFYKEFYNNNKENLIGPGDKNFTPKYNEHTWGEGKDKVVKNNIPFFSFKFGLIITPLRFYFRKHNPKGSFGNWLILPINTHETKLEYFEKKSLFSKKFKIHIKGHYEPIFDLNPNEYSKDIELFKRFLKDLKDLHKESSELRTNKKTKILIPGLDKLDYDSSFVTKLLNLVSENGQIGIGGPEITIKNGKIYLQGYNLLTRENISEEIRLCDKVISFYLNGILGSYVKKQIKQNQYGDKNVILKYLSHEEIKSEGLNLVDSFNEIRTINEKISFFKEFSKGKKEYFLNEKSVITFEKLESLLELIKEYFGYDINSIHSKIKSIEIVGIYSTLLNSLPKPILNLDSVLTNKFVKIENKLKTREEKINTIVNDIKKITDIGLLQKIVTQIQIQDSQFQHLVYISCNLIKSYELDDKLTFYRIYEELDKLRFFESSWETTIISELTDVNQKLDEIIVKINNLEKNLISSIQILNEDLTTKMGDFNNNIKTQLKDIDNSIQMGNWVNIFNTVQNYKTNRRLNS